MAKDVIIALDFDSKEKAFEFLDCFQEEVFVKVGMELFYKEGPEIVRELKKRGHKIFLDLKLHDIPNTVKKAMRSLMDLQVDMVNVHIAGGSEMIQGVRNVLEEQENPPIFLGVTMLTSSSEEMIHSEIKIDPELSLEDTVASYLETGLDAGLDGIVCSAQEVPALRKKVTRPFITVTPGIRLSTIAGDDQVRIVTPIQARENGSDYIVVGRPITKAENPREAYLEIYKNFVEGIQ